jgi:hypothetical protein
MKVFFCRLISHLLVISLIALPFSTQAALVGTDEVVKQAQTQSDRDRVRDFVARADVQNELQSYGVSAQTAKERVDALTDMEVQQIAGKLDALPAGAIGTGETVLIVVLLVVVIYLVLKYVYK